MSTINNSKEIWKQLLKKIQEIPAELFSSGDFKEFIQNAQDIADKKEVENAARLRVNNDLLIEYQKVSLLLMSWENYFHFRDYQKWSVNKLAPESLEIVKINFKKLGDELPEFDALLKVQPTSKEERRMNQTAIEMAEESISSSYSVLSRVFGFTSESSSSREDGSTLLANQPEKTIENRKRESHKKKPTESESKEEHVTEHDPAQLTSVDFGNPPEIILAEPDSIPTTKDLIPERSGELEAVKDNSTESVMPTVPRVGDNKLEQPFQIDQSPSTDADAAQSVLSFMAAGSMPRAFWVAEAMEQLNKQTPAPSWLIAGIQGTHWMMNSWPDRPREFLASIRELVLPKSRVISSSESILALSVAIGLSPLENGAGWEDWLAAEIPSSAKGLNQTVEALAVFTQSGNTLVPIIVQSILGEEQVEAHVKEQSRKAREWILQASFKRTRFTGSERVWQSIVGAQGTIHAWYDLVAQDKRNKVEDVESQLTNWSRWDWLDKHIKKQNRLVMGITRTIDGEARDQLIRWLIEASHIAKEWSSAILQAERGIGEKKWAWEQTQLLIESLKSSLPEAISETEAFQETTSDFLDKIGYRALNTTLRLLGIELGILNNQKPDSQQSFFVLDNQNIQQALARLLILFPELSLNDDGIPAGGLSEKDLAVLVRADHSPTEAFDLWMDRKDYRFTETLIRRLENNQDDARKKRNEMLGSDIKKLDDEEIDRTIVRTEQAFADGIVAEEEYISDISTIESIRKQVKNFTLGGDNDELPDISRFFLSLESIRGRLDTRHTDRINKFNKTWQSILAKLPGIVEDDNNLNLIIALVERSFRERDLRTVAEVIAHLDGVLAGNYPLSMELFINTKAEYEVRKFNKELVSMIQALDNISLTALGDDFSSGLPNNRTKEVKETLYTWVQLKNEKSLNAREGNFSAVITILKYLGWDVSGPTPVSIGSRISDNFSHWRVKAKPMIQAPVPLFGSERMKQNGIYDVIGVWGRPGFDSIEALMNQIGKIPCVMLYFARLQPSQRAELARLTKKKQLPLIIIDELLMLHLAKEYNVRLSAMFECTLPYAYVNPYVPHATGSVPPEMYFGRKNEIKLLKDFSGPAIVYGGRQLGKSALLKQVERSFHDPEHGHFAIYEDVRLIGDSMAEQDYRSAILERIITALTRERIIDIGRQSMDFDKLSEFLISRIKEKGWQVLLLLDESDKFLQADAKKNFPVVTQLKRVMDQTDRMFKVVLAGLQSVQRFKNISNQPLAHLGDSGAIQIGPLEPEAAFDLIEKPLRALGYVFGKPDDEDPSLITHILSYTNYHPGLLQLFGYYLTEHMNSKQQGINSPPYSISRADIEAVYRNQKVRETIRERFKITLVLDKRYEAIALSLITEQWEEKNGFDRLFTPEELFSIASRKWPAGFADDMYPDKFRGFLDEMCGLGVLSIASSGTETRRYRLRSPNLVSLMGTQEQIFSQLDDISKSKLDTEQQILESYHAPINPPYFSPLTYAQESVIKGNTNESGVIMAFGSAATRIYSLAEALKLTSQKVGSWVEINISTNSGVAIKEQLKKAVKQNLRSNYILAYRELQGSPEEMADQVISASKFCRQDNEMKIRVVFMLDSLSAAKWFQLPRQIRENIEQGIVEVVVSLNFWNTLGIHQLLDQHTPELSASDAVIKKIRNATGGVPSLLDKFIDLCKPSNDPGLAVDDLRKWMQQKTETMKILSDLGINEPDSRKFLEFVLKEKEDELESFSADECLELIFDSAYLAQAHTTMEYLNRLSIVQIIPYLRVEPVVAGLFHESQL